VGFHLFGRDAVVLGDLAVDAEEDRLFLMGRYARRILPSAGSILTCETYFTSDMLEVLSTALGRDTPRWGSCHTRATYGW
jgi:hypothetical protein